MTGHRHVHPTPPAQSGPDADLARWADDGGAIPTPSPRAAELERHWLRISAALTARLPDLAGRDDIIVTCEHATRSGAPAAFYPTLASIEVSTSVFAPQHPARIHPDRPGDEDRYPAAWGALVHEAAHAAHSVWTTPTHLLGTALDAAAQLLEESRAEHAHLGRRPADRRYLRAVVRQLILDDLGTNPPSTRWHTAHAAALVLARRDAGILDTDEAQPLQDLAEQILGPDLLNQLARIWQAAHATADTDTTAMLDHARAWCEALRADPVTPPPPLGNHSGATHGPGPLADAVTQVTGRIVVNERAQASAEQSARAASARRSAAKAEQTARQREAAATAKAVFAPGARPHTPASAATRAGRRPRSPITGTRPPPRSSSAPPPTSPAPYAPPPTASAPTPSPPAPPHPDASTCAPPSPAPPSKPPEPPPPPSPGPASSAATPPTRPCASASRSTSPDP